MGLLRFTDFKHLWRNISTIPAYGWVPDPYDERDEKHEFGETRASTRATTSASSIDNREYFKPISNQWHMPSCGPNAGADYLESVAVHHKFHNMEGSEGITEIASNQPDYSRMFIWWNARNEMDPPRIRDTKSGTYNRLVMDVAARFGVPEERYWPYDEKRLPPRYDKRPVVRPSLSAYRNARRHTIREYHALKGRGDDRLQQVVQALLVGPGVLFGTALGSDFGNVGSKVLGIPRDTVGRHAMVLCGYDRQKSAFLVRNSHGKGFGMDGYLWMHESYVAWTKTRSLWVCTRGVM